jgi:lysophospholipase L1-like esterase
VSLRRLRRLVLFVGLLAVAASAAPDDAAKRRERFQPDFDRFAAADRDSPPAGGGVLLVGSSVFRLWTDAAAQLAPLPVRNRAFGGSRTGDQLARFEQLAPVYRPDVVVYYCGSNDLRAGHAPEEIFARFREFAERLERALPAAPLVFVSSTRSPDRRDKWDRVDRFNALVAAYCAGKDRRHFVDINPALADPTGEPRPGVYRDDNLHPTAAGYAAIAAVLRPRLAEIWDRTRAGAVPNK